MSLLPFKKSAVGSIGVELEFQVVNPCTYDLISRSKELINNISTSKYKERIKPEITQSIIEINSSIHESPGEMYQEFLDIHSFLLHQAKQVGVCFCGGGTHPFQKWSMRKIFPTRRYKQLSKQYRYLSKRSTVFGQHIHIGCGGADDALYLTHALAKYVPQLIAISASSPFYQSVDTGYQSSRSNMFNEFPLSGVIPYVKNWQEFSDYYYMMRNLNIIESMKDFYWDIRPKPEFGTVELRICDVPLTIKKSIVIAAYVQALSHYLLAERINVPTPNLYYLYKYNRFQAGRYGFDGEIIDADDFSRRLIADDILQTITNIKKYTDKLNNNKYISLLKRDVLSKNNDAKILRDIYNNVGSLQRVVQEQCKIWADTK